MKICIMSNLHKNIKVIEALELANENSIVELNYNSITISAPKNRIINLLKEKDSDCFNRLCNFYEDTNEIFLK